MAQPRCVILARRADGAEARWVQNTLAACCDLGSAVTEPAGVPGLGADSLIIAVAQTDELDADIALLTAVRLRLPRHPVLVVGSGLSRPQISRVLLTGAYDYAAVGSSDDELLARVMRGTRFLPPLEGVCGPQPENRARVSGLVGSSPAFLKVLGKLPLLARCNSNVLIQG